jgi:hypothetical protein
MAPESTMKAFLEVLRQVSLYVRSCHDRMTGEQLFDLMDAIHNVPEMLIHHSESYNAETMRDLYFRPYDKKWATDGKFSLVDRLDKAMSSEV